MTRRQILRRLLGLAVMLTVAAILIRLIAGHAEELRRIEWGQHPGWLACHVFFQALTFLAMALGWHECLRAVDGPLRLRPAMVTWLLPNLGKYAPGKVLMYAGRLELTHREGVPRFQVAAAVAIEVLLVIAATLPFALFSLGQGLALDRRWAATVLLLALIGFLALVALPALWLWPLNMVLRKAGRDPIDATPRRWPLVTALLAYVVCWCCHGFAGTCLVRALDLELGSAGPLVVPSALVTAWLVGFLSFLTPAGLGVREGVMVALLGPTLGAGPAAVLAVVARLSWAIVELLGVLMGWLLQHRTRQDDPTHAPPIPRGTETIP